MITLKNRKTSPNSVLFDPFFFGPQKNFIPTHEKKAIQSRIYTNILKQDDAYEIELAAPGFKKDDFHIDIVDSKLKITFNKEDAEQNTELKYTKQEFKYGSFTKSFNLSNDIDTAKIKASYDLGILKITLPKAEKIVTKIAVK